MGLKKYDIVDVFSENKLLALTYQEKSYEENKAFVYDSFDIVLNNEYKQYISPILYEALMSLIFKTSIKHFCDDIMPENGMAIDVTGKNYRCFRFWGKDLTDKEIDFHNAKESIDLCKNCEFKGMCMECTANKIDGYKTKLRTAISSIICDKQKLFEYIIERIVLLSKDQNKLKCLVNNFPNFIQYA